METNCITHSNVLSGLNEQQLALAQHIYGPLICVAGPGSGKTHTMVSRTAYLIEQGISPDSILMFSFTKKAANEIKERILKRIPNAQNVTVGTYHSFCSRLLRKYAHHIGFEHNFTIYDTEDSKKLLKEVANDPFYKPDWILSKISSWKSYMITPNEAEQGAEDEFERKIAAFYREYQRRLKEANAMDFDDLIGHSIDLLTDHDSVRYKVNERYQFIVGDEFQDSSAKDIEFIRLLAGDDQNVCMVMDDFQSIYGFRGANIDAVLSLEEVFPDIQTLLLEQNYRSTSTIVNASMSIISNNKSQMKKTIFTENDEGEKVVICELNSQYEEAARITKIVKGLVKSDKYTYKDIAILYRMSNQSRSIEESFLSNAVPYTVISGLPFYARKEIKDIMAYIRLLFNPRDKQSFERAVGIPKRGIGSKAIEQIISVAKEQKSAKMSLIEASKETELKGKAKTGILSFNNVLARLQEKANNGATPEELVKATMDLIAYKKLLLEENDNTEDRLQNLEELLVIAQQYETLDDFIYNMSLNSVESEEEVEDKVQLLTMHASKGLEFPIVIVIGANEGTSPHFRATTTKQVDEERRLFFVAVSRAEELLFITRPKNVTIRGQSMRASASRFINEIDEVYLMRI